MKASQLGQATHIKQLFQVNYIDQSCSHKMSLTIIVIGGRVTVTGLKDVIATSKSNFAPIELTGC